jgi:hypothetical protein
MTDELKDLEARLSMVMAAVGVVVAQTLVELDAHDEVLATLQRKCVVMRRILRASGDAGAEEMFSTFERALRDPRFFEQTD